MIDWLGLMLVAAAAGLGASTVASVLVWMGLPAARLLPPTRRADALLALALLPAFAAMGAALAVATPSVLHALQIRPDHCAEHGHHGHLCAVHGALPEAWLAFVGAVAVAVFLGRAVVVVDRLWRTTARVARLEAWGAVDATGSDLVWVPGSPWLCLAIGVRRPRVLASRSLPDHLGEARWLAALAHERAHLRRRDPAMTLVVAAAHVWLWPGRSVVAAWREAAEQAADAGAAAETSALDVAEAMVAVARLRPDMALQPALAAVALERRIAVLLDGPSDRGSARPVGVLFTVTIVAVLVAAWVVDPAHHTIESVLATFRP